MFINGAVKPVHNTKCNESMCRVYNTGCSFHDLYLNPSNEKTCIYHRIVKEALATEHSSIHCRGNCATFSASYIFKKDGKYYLRYISKSRDKVIEVEARAH